MFDLDAFFKKPASIRQKQYEAVRAFIIEKLTVEQIANTFGYKPSTIQSMIRDARHGKLDLFPTVNKGPRQRRTPTDIQEKIISFRKQNLSSPDICDRLGQQEISISIRTIERILLEAGFNKLPRRTFQQRGVTSRNKIIPARSEHLNFEKLEPFNIDCPVAGIFFFLPYILESGILPIVEKCNLPGSSGIAGTQAFLALLLLKLIGNKRLSHMDGYDQEPGLGVFAGLNVLPKTTYMCTYSCRSSEEMLLDLQEKIVKQFRKIYPKSYNGKYINLDFHSIPHYGDEKDMEKIWHGSKGRAMKGANTVFVQDSVNNTLLYTRTDILRKEEADEILKFVAYWKKVKGEVDETLVFDCKFTKYDVLDQLDQDGIKFITLRKRNKKLIQEALDIEKELWTKVKLPIPKRKYNKVSVYEDKQVQLTGYTNYVRQITIKDHGREKPTFVITNDRNLEISKVLEVYAKRWHIENKIAEMIAFFNLNALSCPLMIRIHFDVLMTMIADTLYHSFTKDLRRFEKNIAPTIFKKFINMPGRVVWTGEKFIIKIRKRAHTPILLGLEKLKTQFSVPWLNGATVEIEWTA